VVGRALHKKNQHENDLKALRIVYTKKRYRYVHIEDCKTARQVGYKRDAAKNNHKINDFYIDFLG